MGAADRHLPLDIVGQERQPVVGGGVDGLDPLQPFPRRRQAELDVVVAGVEQHVPALADAVDHADIHGKRLPHGGVPILIGELVAIRVIPVDLMAAGGGAVPAVIAQLQVGEDGGLRPQRHHLLGEGEQPLILRAPLPVDPADLVVLTVGVVVAKLAAAHLVAGEEVGSALGEQQGGDQVAFLLLAQVVDARIQGRPLDAVVAGEVVAVAVAVILAVGLIVALVVGDQILQGEAVVIAEVVDAGVGRAPVLREEIPRADQPGSKVAHLARIAAPEGAHRVTIAVVDLQPLARELAEAIAEGADIPGFGDELDL